MPTLLVITDAEYPEEYKGEQVHPVEDINILPVFKWDTVARNKPLYFDWSDGSATFSRLMEAGKRRKNW